MFKRKLMPDKALLLTDGLIECATINPLGPTKPGVMHNVNLIIQGFMNILSVGFSDD